MKNILNVRQNINDVKYSIKFCLLFVSSHANSQGATWVILTYFDVLFTFGWESVMGLLTLHSALNKY